MSTIPKLAIGLSAAMLLAGAAGAQSSPEAGQPDAAAPAAGAGGDFATYDADQSGSLDAAEFSSWYQATHQTGKDGNPVSADELSRKAAEAFSQADADHDQRVSQAEIAGVPAG